MFIWTISDVIGVAVAIVVMTVIGFIAVARWLTEAFCKHDGGVTETRQCHAICRKCGKDLGFIGDWRKKRNID